jgi:nicotinamide phosphoribosyltransferase
MESFGHTTNSKGYKVLPNFIRVVQGDGVRRETLPKVFIELERRGLAADNAVFGMGGGLLQHCHRDTLEFGMKGNAAMVNGEWIDIAKSPTGDSMKVSKAGRLALQYVDGDYKTVRRDAIPEEENQLVPVYRNGQLLKKWDFSELIERSEQEYPEHYYAEAIAPMLRSGEREQDVAVEAAA